MLRLLLAQAGEGAQRKMRLRIAHRSSPALRRRRISGQDRPCGVVRRRDEKRPAPQTLRVSKTLRVCPKPFLAYRKSSLWMFIVIRYGPSVGRSGAALVSTLRMASASLASHVQ